VLSDEHSEFDGEEGTVTQVMETMFGDATYTVSFDEGQETGVPADALVAVLGWDIRLSKPDALICRERSESSLT
jgi:hypothetical protein